MPASVARHEFRQQLPFYDYETLASPDIFEFCDSLKVERHRPCLHAFQFVDRVIAHQGGIVRDAFVGDGQHRKNAVGDSVEGAELFTAAEFASDFLRAESTGFLFELRTRIAL